MYSAIFLNLFMNKFIDKKKNNIITHIAFKVGIFVILALHYCNEFELLCDCNQKKKKRHF